jgi:hypothetical protein
MSLYEQIFNIPLFSIRTIPPMALVPFKLFKEDIFTPTLIKSIPNTTAENGQIKP